ncbi:MAG: T9SS type A sorting domain-containing protein, partial [Flavobacteriia bacterium]|nr:T9SS type A sorting domain-containing protein [Flavobacteriia bacterium]
WTAPATLPAIGYYIAVVPTGNTPAQADYFTAASSATTFTTDTLKNGTALADGSTYDVYVMAVCAHGAGGYATPIQDDVTVTDVACPAATALVLTDNTDGSLTASWTAPATLPAIGYYIAVVPTGNTPAQADYFTAASSATTFTTDTLKNGTALADGSTYDVHVMAVCAHGAGGYATPIQDDVTVTISSASCQDPANITITDNGNASVNISWTAPATIPQNGYYYAVVPQGTTPSVPNDYVNTSATSLTNINATTLATGSAPLTGGTTYTFHLRSFCFHGAGGYGNEFENDFTLTLGVNDIHSEISGIYPNPAETTLTIDTKAEEGIISIVDLTGKTIATSAIKGNSTTISVSDLPGGMYQVVLSTSNTTSVSKFVKK